MVRQWSHPAKILKLAVLVCFLWACAHLLEWSNNYTPSISLADGTPNNNNRDGICRAHGWKPFKHQGEGYPPRKVYDLMMVNTELDWLEIRLNSTWDAVDYFVLVEGSKTFTLLDKPLVLKENLHKLDAYRDKIIYHEIEYPDDWKPGSAWEVEDFQRNSMFDQVFPRLQGRQVPTWGDVIVVSDVDEIPRPETFALLKACRFPRRLTLRSRFYYYSFQYLHRGPEWAHPEATYYQGPAKTLRPNDLRMGLNGWFLSLWWERGQLANASWHCSSCFATMEELLVKMRAFSHTSYNAARFREPAHIADRVRNGKDLWDRPGEEYDRIEDNRDVPSFLLQNRERFGYMLNRDGPSAGFVDYHPDE